MKKINESFASAELKNTLYAEGYRYIVKGDFAITKGTDPWSGMPNTTNNLYAFVDKVEAEDFAVTQIWVFNPDVHANVEEIPAHTETMTEWRERMKREDEEKKARKEAREKAKAKAEGMTIEEWKEVQKKKAKVKRIQKEIKEAEEEIERLMKAIETKKRYLEKLGE